jgi:hypothetical protein
MIIFCKTLFFKSNKPHNISQKYFLKGLLLSDLRAVCGGGVLALFCALAVSLFIVLKPWRLGINLANCAVSFFTNKNNIVKGASF